MRQKVFLNEISLDTATHFYISKYVYYNTYGDVVRRQIEQACRACIDHTCISHCTHEWHIWMSYATAAFISSPGAVVL